MQKTKDIRDSFPSVLSALADRLKQAEVVEISIPATMDEAPDFSQVDDTCPFS